MGKILFTLILTGILIMWGAPLRADCGEPHGTTETPSTPDSTPTTTTDNGGGSTTTDTGSGGHTTEQQMGRTFDPGEQGSGGPLINSTGKADASLLDPFELRRAVVEHVTETLRSIARNKALNRFLRPHVRNLKNARNNLHRASDAWNRAAHNLREAGTEVERWKQVHRFYEGSTTDPYRKYEQATQEALDEALNDPKYKAAVEAETQAQEAWGEARQAVDNAIDAIDQAKTNFHNNLRQPSQVP